MNRIVLHATMVTACCAAALMVGCASPNPGDNGTTAGGNGSFGASTEQPGQYQHPDVQGEGSPPSTGNNANSASPAPKSGGM